MRLPAQLGPSPADDVRGGLEKIRDCWRPSPLGIDVPVRAVEPQYAGDVNERQSSGLPYLGSRDGGDPTGMLQFIKAQVRLAEAPGNGADATSSGSTIAVPACRREASVPAAAGDGVGEAPRTEHSAEQCRGRGQAQ